MARKLSGVEPDIGQIVSLIGMPGGGKSTIGRRLAKRLGVPFADTDKTIEQRTGNSIAELFVRSGEAVFRDLEAEILATLVATGPSVIATGGGAVLRAANRDLLRTRTRCIYLSAGPDFLWSRLRCDRRRPLLQVPEPEERLREMSREREPLYRDTASIVIEIEGLPFDRLMAAVMAHLTDPVRPR